MTAAIQRVGHPEQRLSRKAARGIFFTKGPTYHRRSGWPPFWLAAFLVGRLLLYASAAQAAIVPELPRVLIDTTLPVSANTCTTTVSAGGDLQAALDAANLGDTICLANGATWSGSFLLREKTTGSGWITIRPQDWSFLPAPGTRISPRINPAQAAQMPKLLAFSVDPDGAIHSDARAHHYRIIGLEISIAPNYPYPTAGSLVNLGSQYINGSSNNPVATLADLPHDITFDRVYVHGDGVREIVRAFAANALRFALVDSFVSQIWMNGADTQAVNATNSAGPFKIVNNYLEAAGENVMFGGTGGGTNIPNIVEADIEIRQNYFFKPLSWKVGDPTYDGITRTIKNLLEFKNAERVLVEGNVLENNWPAQQNGGAILMNGVDGPTSFIDNITIRKNIVKNATQGVAVGGCCAGIGATINTLLVQNNVFDDMKTDIPFRMHLPWVDQYSIDHNTVANSAPLSATFTPADPVGTITGATFTNNIVPFGTYAFVNLVSSPAIYSGMLITHNALPGPVGDPLYQSVIPSGNFFPTDMSGVGFVNFHSGAGGDYHLLSSSPYKNAGTDGKDVGADIDAILAATQGVAVGNPPPTTPNNPTTAVTPGSLNPQVFPNPWRSDRHIGKTITFANLPLGSTTKIFTTSGHQLKELANPSLTSVTWDLTNDKGDKVASGIYVYLITDGQGNKAKGKVAVIK